MINIEEKQSSKVPGKTSLFVSFNYNQEILNIIKTLDVANFDKKTKLWEIPTSNLAKFLDSVVNIDEVNLKVLPDKSIKPDINYELSEYNFKPFPYQAEGIQYGLNHDCWLLLDAPGLGKSFQMIHLAEELKKHKKINHCMIICGINTLKYNWKKEIAMHSNLSAMILGERTRKKSGKKYIGSVNDRIEDLLRPIDEFFVITNIETIRNNDIVKAIKKGPNKFDMMVADECHKFKNPTAQQSKNFLKLTDSKYRIGLTGTLLLNNPLDAYVPLKWIGVERCPYTNFKYYYCNFGGPFGNEILNYKNIPILKDNLSECSLRRTKDLLDLPPKTIIHEFVEMDNSQSAFYENIVKGIVDQVDKVNISTSSLLAMLSRLRQAVDCPTYLTTENIPSAKIERAIDLVEQIVSSGEKVVIFSSFKETLNQLMGALNKFNPLLCTGDIKEDIISDNISMFQNDDEHKVMLCTISKMGTGITLTKASYAIFLGSSWTAAENTQCEDRIYRIGSNKPVTIYYLWTANTVDEKIKDIVEDKELIADFIIDGVVPANLMDKLKSIIEEL